jgi:malate dehydrogenase (quinone)
MKRDLTPDILLIGGGIMSATLGVLYKLLEPKAHIILLEKLPHCSEESSNAWNNAGTGHAAYCELNYTPQVAGEIDISKALKIASQFEVSKCFWSYLITQGAIENNFLHKVPHHSVVFDDDISFLKKRFEAMQSHYLFGEMKYSESADQLLDWLPLMMDNRTTKMAATKMEQAADIDFGALTQQLLVWLKKQDNVEILTNHEVRNIAKDDNNKWFVEARNLTLKETHSFVSPFVFIGAGGGSLPLLQKANLPEADGYGGFPVSGQFLKCTDPDIIAQHAAKAYGKAGIGAPPMSVPHLDTRWIDGKQELLFGPFAGFSTKFLKHGSYFDLPESVEFHNMFPLLSAGWRNMPLTKYLIQQVQMTAEDRLKDLQQFVPNAQLQDWKLITAGQRVQVIKKDDGFGGKLEFGTELVCANDGTMAALLGASPGASTSVSAMMDVLKKCFANKIPVWQNKLVEIMPSFGKTLADHKELGLFLREKNNSILGLS